MHQFLADLHIHSRFSRATSKKLSIPLLAAWAGVKGLSVLGTGDFTHPRWRDELRRFLTYDERSGLYALADSSAFQKILPDLPVEILSLGDSFFAPGARERMQDTTGLALPPLRFMLQTEISSIYKRGGKVRKVHNLVFMPTLEAAERFSVRLSEIGNLNSDGRPIIGLDSRDLLELVLETDPAAFLIPAHIWTPWFSLFGSKSGFDSLEECFADLSSHVFALETGLSSDPAMNRLWSSLDSYRLISNSDAHSGDNLGREANVFCGEISYSGMLTALKNPERAVDTRFLGTLEFFPEEGKYHMDGHRKCRVRLSPRQTWECGGICPVCGGALTVGVLSRVVELADRDQPVYGPGEGAADGPGDSGFASLVPLPEILSEILGKGTKTLTVTEAYADLLGRFGPELHILLKTPIEELRRRWSTLGEAIRRMRLGLVERHGGYDGEYGVVRMFSEEERAELAHSSGRKSRVTVGATGFSLLKACGQSLTVGTRSTTHSEENTLTASHHGISELDDGVGVTFSEVADNADAGDLSWAATVEDLESAASRNQLNAEQELAMTAGPSPVLVLAGPGTGKTRTLVARVVHLLDEGIDARRILAVTFTRRAAGELEQRLARELGNAVRLPRADTLHALALEQWHATQTEVPMLLSEENARNVFAAANPQAPAQLIREAWKAINLARERMLQPEEYALMANLYSAQKNIWNLADYTDLLEFRLDLLEQGHDATPWEHVLVDEIQDLSLLQLTLVSKLLTSSGEGFFGIGDPAQSIYGFRGAHGHCQRFLKSLWPGLDLISLERNYRSLPDIVGCAHSALGSQANPLVPQAARRGVANIRLFAATSVEAEAQWVADRVAALIGLGSHTLEDAACSRAGGDPQLPGQKRVHELSADHTPGDVAVLVRTNSLGHIYRNALRRKGVPVSEPALEAFWKDERVALILAAAASLHGVCLTGSCGETEKLPPCPTKIFNKGPLGIAAYLTAIAPFDALFWKNSAFRALVKAFDASKDWPGLLTWITLQDELELVKSKAETVQIMSMHAAKGLEFRSVFLPALEDGILPFAGTDVLTGKLGEKQVTADAEEEQRLFYVALTRAQDALYLSYSSKRSLYGRELRLKPSRFLDPLPEELLSRSTLVPHVVRREQDLKLF